MNQKNDHDSSREPERITEADSFVEPPVLRTNIVSTDEVEKRADSYVNPPVARVEPLPPDDEK